MVSSDRGRLVPLVVPQLSFSATQAPHSVPSPGSAVTHHRKGQKGHGELAEEEGTRACGCNPSLVHTQHTQAPTQLCTTHMGPHTCICPGTRHAWGHATPNPAHVKPRKCALTCSPAYAGLWLGSAASFIHTPFRTRKEVEGGELSPWMPRPFLGFLPERPRGSQGQDGLSGPSSQAIPHKPCPECSEKAGKVLSGAWSSMCPALRVTSSR